MRGRSKIPVGNESLIFQRYHAPNTVKLQGNIFYHGGAHVARQTRLNRSLRLGTH